jgi:hypothetical protein
MDTGSDGEQRLDGIANVLFRAAGENMAAGMNVVNGEDRDAVSAADLLERGLR